MRSSLCLLYNTVLLISSLPCSMCGAHVARRIKRQRPQHLPQALYAAFFASSGGKFAGSAIEALPPHGPQGAFLRRHCCYCCDTSATSLKSWTSAALAAPLQLRNRKDARGAVAGARARRCTTRTGLSGDNVPSSASPPTSPASPPVSSTASSQTSPMSTPGAPACSVAVLAGGNSGDELERCQRLAQTLGVELVIPRRECGSEEEEKHWSERRRGSLEDSAKGENGDFKFVLLFDERGRLALHQPGSGFNPLVVDFSGGKTGHRAKQQQGKTEQVVKAAALPKRRAPASVSAITGATTDHRPPSPSGQPSSSSSPTSDSSRDASDTLPLLWDLTAGLGTDAFLLAQAGWRVQMFERSPVVAAMVEDALDRARVGDDETARETAARMSLTVADSTDFLAATLGSLATETQATGGGKEGLATVAARPDVVYLDPMFPQPKNGKKRKSALVKKGMQMLQALLEEGTDGGGREGQERLADSVGEGEAVEERRLFEVAMSLAVRRVVVKRPVHGAAIVQYVKPSHSVVSKNGRFDVYVVPPE